MNWRIYMSNSKKKIKKMAESNIKILKSGKLKLSKDQKIDISKFVSNSVDKAIVSRLDAIISKEDVVIDSTNAISSASINLTSQLYTVEMLYRVNSPEEYTIVVTTNKKSALNIFDYLRQDTIGALLRASTLAGVYKKLKESWLSLHDKDNSKFTNVMYIPDIMIFTDFRKGDIRYDPIKVNLLVISTPSLSKMNGDEEKPELTEACTRIVNDIVESAIKCGSKNLIIDPFAHKILQKDADVTSRIWKSVVTSQRYKDNIHKTAFTIDPDAEDYFVTFDANMQIIPDTNIED